MGIIKMDRRNIKISENDCIIDLDVLCGKGWQSTHDLYDEMCQVNVKKSNELFPVSSAEEFFINYK